MAASDVIKTSLERNWGMVDRAVDGFHDRFSPGEVRETRIQFPQGDRGNLVGAGQNDQVRACGVRRSLAKSAPGEKLTPAEGFEAVDDENVQVPFDPEMLEPVIQDDGAGIVLPESPFG